MAAAERRLLEAEYDEYADTNANGAAFCRSAALIVSWQNLFTPISAAGFVIYQNDHIESHSFLLTQSSCDSSDITTTELGYMDYK